MSAAGAGQDDRIPELLARIDLDDLVARYGGREARRSGGRTYFHCPGPGHDDQHPSFDTYLGPNGGARRWACRSACGRSGDAIDLIVWLQDCTKAAAIEQLAADVGLERQQDAVRKGPPTRVHPASDREVLLRWCAQRGWGAHVVAELGLTLVEDAYGWARIRFPFHLDGAVLYHQDRAVEDSVKIKWLSPAGGRPIAYEADRLRLAHEERGHVFIVEGVTDVAALVDVYSSPAVVGIPGVHAWRASWAAAFRDLGVYVIGDNDPAGDRFRARVSTDLEGVARAVWNVRVPNGFVDVAAWRRGLDPEAFDAQLMAAVECVAPERLRMAG